MSGLSGLRVGINGFGRIGRTVFRAGFDDLEIVGVNALMSHQVSSHLLKWDSVLGTYDKSVSTVGAAGFQVEGKSIKLFRDENPENIPWGDWGVDVVFECTGAFKKREDIKKHFKAGAKKVLVSAPAEGADFTVVYGVNHKGVTSEHKILSNASCTTNCLAPLAKVLHESVGIEQGLMTTIHSYTNDQRVLDGVHEDLRRARAAAESMIPTTTGAAKTVGKILPELEGRIDGFSVRVPTPNVSLVDFTFTAKKSASEKDINQILTEASKSEEMSGILAVAEAPLVSRDFMGRSESSIVDLLSTMVVGMKMIKVVAWYDNEFGFSKRMIDLAKYWSEQ